MTSRFSRTTDAAATAPADVTGAMDVAGPDAGADVIGSPIEMAPEGDSMDGDSIDGGASMPPAPGADVETIVSAGARKSLMQRKAQRQALLRVAQGMPGMDPMAGMGGGMGGSMGGAAGAPAGGGGLGFSALTVPTAAGDTPADADADADAMPEPGNDKLPFGSICPQCGSKNTDVANGEGSCNDCPAQWKISYKLEMIPSSDKKDDATEADDAAAADPMAGLGPDAGLGAATAPAPAGGAGAPPMGGAPGMGGAPMGPTASNTRVVVRLAYKTTPDIWVRAGQSADESQRLACVCQPVGVVCPSCGHRGENEGVSRVANANGGGVTFLLQL